MQKNDQQIIEKIHTIYFDQKQYSHSKPINDSFRIYLTLFKHFFNFWFLDKNFLENIYFLIIP